MTHRKTIIRALIGTGITFLLLGLTSIPLGIPGEWTWNRVDIGMEDFASIFFGLIFVAMSVLLYLVVCVIGSRHINSDSSWKKWGLLLALCAAGYGWLISLQDSLPFTKSLTKAPFILYYPASSGYFHEARYQIKDTSEFLKKYEAKMTEGDVLHVGTHPPGLFLLNKGLINLCDSSPALTGMVLKTIPDSALQALKNIAENESKSGVQFRQSDWAALWLSVVIIHVLALLTVIPLYFLCEILTESSAAWKTVCFWHLVPALAIFLPKSDALFPFFSILILFLWTKSLTNKSFIHSALAGGVLFIALCFSLAILPTVVLCGFLFAGWFYSQFKEKQHSVSILLQPLMVLACVVVCVLLTWFACDINLIAVWKWNYLNHAGFYDQFTRTWWKWLLINPVELSFSLGIPIVILACFGFMRMKKTLGFSMPSIQCYSILLTWCLLWISGKNSGEAARLWLFLMPWFLIISCFCWSHQPETKKDSASPMNLSPIWLPLLCIQLVTCIVTVLSVFGFQHGI